MDIDTPPANRSVPQLSDYGPRTLVKDLLCACDTPQPMRMLVNSTSGSRFLACVQPRGEQCMLVDEKEAQQCLNDNVSMLDYKARKSAKKRGPAAGSNKSGTTAVRLRASPGAYFPPLTQEVFVPHSFYVESKLIQPDMDPVDPKQPDKIAAVYVDPPTSYETAAANFILSTRENEGATLSWASPYERIVNMVTFWVLDKDHCNTSYFVIPPGYAFQNAELQWHAAIQVHGFGIDDEGWLSSRASFFVFCFNSQTCLAPLLNRDAVVEVVKVSKVRAAIAAVTSNTDLTVANTPFARQSLSSFARFRMSLPDQALYDEFIWLPMSS